MFLRLLKCIWNCCTFTSDVNIDADLTVTSGGATIDNVQIGVSGDNEIDTSNLET